jgi:hypothetical protein
MILYLKVKAYTNFQHHPLEKGTKVRYITIALNQLGRLAQLVRASRLHREGHRFESYIAHQRK